MALSPVPSNPSNPSGASDAAAAMTPPYVRYVPQRYVCPLCPNAPPAYADAQAAAASAPSSAASIKQKTADLSAKHFTVPSRLDELNAFCAQEYEDIGDDYYHREPVIATADFVLTANAVANYSDTIDAEKRLDPGIAGGLSSNPVDVFDYMNLPRGTKLFSKQHAVELAVQLAGKSGDTQFIPVRTGKVREGKSVVEFALARESEETGKYTLLDREGKTIERYAGHAGKAKAAYERDQCIADEVSGLGQRKVASLAQDPESPEAKAIMKSRISRGDVTLGIKNKAKYAMARAAAVAKTIGARVLSGFKIIGKFCELYKRELIIAAIVIFTALAIIGIGALLVFVIYPLILTIITAEVVAAATAAAAAVLTSVVGYVTLHPFNSFVIAALGVLACGIGVLACGIALVFARGEVNARDARKRHENLQQAQRAQAEQYLPEPRRTDLQIERARQERIARVPLCKKNLPKLQAYVAAQRKELTAINVDKRNTRALNNRYGKVRCLRLEAKARGLAHSIAQLEDSISEYKGIIAESQPAAPEQGPRTESQKS